jgi:protein-tyrosine phosphatase
MLPLIDTHVHLFAARDDGPGDADTALAMCRMLVAEGAAAAIAVAHQNEHYPGNTAAGLRAAGDGLAAELRVEKVALKIVPAGEVLVGPDFADRLAAGHFLTVADRGQFVLIEPPHETFLDPRPVAKAVQPAGLRLILAHAERFPELLHDPGLTDELIGMGCLIQVTARVLAEPPSAADERMLREWVTRGFVHLLGSDGHGLDRRQPRLRAGYETIRRWAGQAAADRIGHIWASAVLEGRPVNPPRPQPPRKSWFARMFG